MTQFWGVMRLAGGIQGARNTLQTAVLSFVFVSTGGNIAASYCTSLVNQAVFSLLQRHSSERMRLRSAELAAELKGFNENLRIIRDKQNEKKLALGSSNTSDSAPLPSSSETIAAAVVLQQIEPSDETSNLGASITSITSAPVTDPTLTLSSASLSTTESEVLPGDGSDHKVATDQISHALMALDLLIPDKNKDVHVKGN